MEGKSVMEREEIAQEWEKFIADQIKESQILKNLLIENFLEGTF